MAFIPESEISNPATFDQNPATRFSKFESDYCKLLRFEMRFWQIGTTCQHVAMRYTQYMMNCPHYISILEALFAAL